MQNIGRIFNKYLFPFILFVIGMLLVFASGEQTNLFLYGGIAIALSGVLAALFVGRVLSRPVTIAIGVIAGIGAVFFGFKDYDVIDQELKYTKKRQVVSEAVIQRLKDIREAQIAYEREKGKYAETFDSLIDFIKYGNITLIKRLGSLPDSVVSEEEAMELGIISPMPEGMTDAEVISSGLIVRDTIEVDVESYVYNDSYMAKHKTKLYVDSLPYVPYSDHMFEMKTDMISAGGVQRPVILVRDPKPFDEKDAYEFGSLTNASTSGNWSE
ncbi:MAG TPA: hypothetical protein VKY29_05495 [Cryomorphaceae bacterium]|nr:hypothetical protein [Cryomorphaceae bacterium]